MTRPEDITVITSNSQAKKSERQSNSPEKPASNKSPSDKRKKDSTDDSDDHTDDLLDEGLAESFPASDPPSIQQP